MVKRTIRQSPLAVNASELQRAAALYRAVLHPLRLQMVQLIHAAGKLSVTGIVKKLKIEQPLASLQLKTLKDAGFLHLEKKGRAALYSVNARKISLIHSASAKISPLSSAERSKLQALKVQQFTVPGHSLGLAQFTGKERAIIQLICDEKTNAEISEELKLSRRTVEGYRNAILKKMNVKNTAGLVIYAIKHRLFTIKKD